MLQRVVALTAAMIGTGKRIADRIVEISRPRLLPILDFVGRPAGLGPVRRISAQIRDVGRLQLRPIIAFAVGVTVMGGFAFILWPLLSPSEPGTRVIDGRMVRETTGWVARVDHEGRLLQISRSFLGFRRQEFLVGQDTTIVIRDKEGGLGDLDRGMPVRVAWEKVGDKRRTLSVELVAGDSAPRVVAAPRSVEASVDQPRRTDAVPAAPTVSVTPQPSPGASPVARPEVASPSKPDSTVVPSAHPALGVARREATPAVKPDSPAAAPMLDSSPSAPDARKARRPGVARKATPEAESTPVESVVPPSPARASEASPLDGSDAIDWLLENSRRR